MLLITELIRQLREAQDVHGDLPVLDEQDRTIANVEFNNDERPVVILISGGVLDEW